MRATHDGPEAKKDDDAAAPRTSRDRAGRRGGSRLDYGDLNQTTIIPQPPLGI